MDPHGPKEVVLRGLDTMALICFAGRTPTAALKNVPFLEGQLELSSIVKTISRLISSTNAFDEHCCWSKVNDKKGSDVA